MKNLIIGAVVFIVVFTGGLGAVLALKGGSKKEEKPKEEKVFTTRYKINDIVVNPAETDGERFLRVSIALDVRGKEPDLTSKLASYEIEMRDIIINILTSMTLDEILGQNGKMLIKGEIKNRINSIWDDMEIVGIYFTEFVVQ